MSISWTDTTLGAICDDGNGVIKTGPFGSQLHKSDYTEEGVPVVMPTNIDEGRVSVSGIARIGDGNVARLAKHKLSPGDIVYGRRGDIGRQALITKRENGWLCGTGCLRISLGDGIVDPVFLHYYLREEDVIRHISNQAVGATMPNLNTKILRSIPVRHPDLPTQRKIAGILSAYDDLIENNLRRIKILEQMAQTLYREWFVHFRFPGHESATFKDSELGRIPDGWEVVTVNDMCDRVTDGSHSSPPSVEEGMPMVSSKDMHTFGLNLETSRTISHSDYEKLVRNGCKPRANDILITKDGANYLKYIFVVEKDLDVVLLSSIAMLTPNSRINPHLFAAVLNSLENKERLKNFVTGAAIPRIILKDFKQFQFVLPPRELQAEWAKVGEFSTKLCWDIIAKNKNLRRTRDLLLPKLLSPSN